MAQPGPPPPPPRGPEDATFVEETVEPVPQRRVVVDEAPPPRNLWPWLLALLFAVAAIVFFVLWWTNRDNADTNSVPNLAGMQEQQARTEADASGFDVKVVRRSGGPAGTVLDQGPEPGVELQAGAQMLLVVSSGAQTSVPNVTGMNVDAAKQALTAQKLTPQVQQVDSNQPAGLVLSQDPVAGTKVAGGAQVRLAVSKGPEMVTVPSLRGLSLENATQKLSDVGLTARIIRVSSSEPEGTVIAQDPAGGQKVKKGSAVRINVSQSQATTITTGGAATTATVTVTVTTLTDTTAIP